MKSFNEQFYFCVNKHFLSRVVGEELSGGKCLSQIFSRWELSGRELPGWELSVWQYYLGGGGFTGHQFNCANMLF